jgi:phospholipid/cholesterol/gamma-HCH transport system permease protein
MQLLGEIGDMMILTGKTLVSAIRPPYTYGNEFAIQFMFTLRLCWLPLLVTSVCVNYAVPGLEGGNFQQILGSLDRLGSFYGLAAIREFAPFVCAIIVSGVAGTAITADLGARKIREELDALQVLGVDPVKNLVVPRFLALMIATALFDVFAIAAGVGGGVIATLQFHGEVGPFLATFWGSGSTTEIWGSLLKCTIYGSIVAIVCCYKGMTASGGAEGVGKAVNQAVVIALLAVGAFNYVFTQTLLATHPDMSVLH